MSKWTHVQGVIRFEYFLESLSPTGVDYNPVWATKIIEKIFCKSLFLPQGSEGPVGAQMIYGSRGPVLVLEGDLRDFSKEQLGQFISWLNDCYEELQKGLEEANREYAELEVRDCWINFDVEYDKTIYAIMFDDESDKELIELGRTYRGIFKLIKLEKQRKKK